MKRNLLIWGFFASGARQGLGAALALAAVLGTSAALSQALAPAAAIEARQGQFREIGTAFKAINDELKKAAPGKFLLASSARQIATDLRQVRTMFPVGSGPATHVKMKALPGIWTDRAKFDALNLLATGEADKLVSATRGGDLELIRAQVRAVGEACKSCHRQFRAEDD